MTLNGVTTAGDHPQNFFLGKCCILVHFDTPLNEVWSSSAIKHSYCFVSLRDGLTERKQ